MLRTEIYVKIGVITETPFAKVFSCVRVSAVADDSLNTTAFRQMCRGRIMICRPAHGDAGRKGYIVYSKMLPDGSADTNAIRT